MEAVTRSSILTVRGSNPATAAEDHLAVEEPLELRLGERGLSITMRTPGNDFELAAGFLFTEGIIQSRNDIADIRSDSCNVVQIKLAVAVDFKRLERHFYSSSSCGVCGKSTIESLRTVTPELAEGPLVSERVILGLPARLRGSQELFEQTGGMHASALFTADGELKSVREDVGRHNALDKVIGGELFSGRLPLSASVLLVSGRASFELVQKAAMAGISVFVAIGAPSSLAVELARETGMTLIGFLREERFNIYCGAEGIRP